MIQTPEDMREEAYRAFCRQEALEHQRRKDAGVATVRLVPAADEPPVFSNPYQAEFRELKAKLSKQGVDAEAHFMALDSTDAISGYTGEFLIPFAQIAGPIVGVVVGAWLQSKAGRKIRIRIGDVEVEATTKDALTKAELEKILQNALKESRTKGDNDVHTKERNP